MYPTLVKKKIEKDKKTMNSLFFWFIFDSSELYFLVQWERLVSNA